MVYHTIVFTYILLCFCSLSYSLPYNSAESLDEISTFITTDKPANVVGDYDNRYERPAGNELVFEGTDNKRVQDAPEVEEYDGAENIDSALQDAIDKGLDETRARTEHDTTQSHTTPGYSGSSSSSSEELEASSGTPVLSENEIPATVVKRDDNNVLLHDKELRRVVNEAIQYAIRDSVNRGISDDIHYEREI